MWDCSRAPQLWWALNGQPPGHKLASLNIRPLLLLTADSLVVMAYSLSGVGLRGGGSVIRNIPPRIKKLLFTGQWQQTLTVCASVCSSPVSLISHCCCHPCFWSLHLCHPGLFVPILSPSPPRLTCTPPASLAWCFIGGEAVSCWGWEGVVSCCLLSGHRHFNGYWLEIVWILSVSFIFLFLWFTSSSLTQTFLHAHLNHPASQSLAGAVLFCSSFQ